MKKRSTQLPAGTATGDLMQAQARQIEKQAAIDAALAEAEALDRKIKDLDLQLECN